ncbi:FHA domain-containing protein [Caballeronia sordidicola]|uniref:FHA domain-containing protein n=1 Tax=Caballeronia sordidicola TaxID=196367 RepID=A0A158I9J7_CABSO|nr:type VI secretion system-associated FHA domain protein TagH [Caballeronia sordidicola]SAL53272.1 FHA domain-containing protein [Caballeronia sordidicola]
MSSNDPNATKLRMTLSGGETTAARNIEFDTAGGTLGRAPECTVVLHDTQRAISRVQARIEWRDGAFVLIDTGSNPTLLNDQILDGSRQAQLHEGDRLRIGPYSLDVFIEQDPQDLQDPQNLTMMTRPQVPATPAPMPEKPDWDVKPVAPLIPDDWNAPHEASKESHANTPFTPDPLASTPLLREPARFGVDANQELIDALGAPGGALGIGPAKRHVSPFAVSGSSKGFEHVSPERAMSAVPALLPINEQRAASMEGDVDSFIPPIELKEGSPPALPETAFVVPEPKAQPQPRPKAQPPEAATATPPANDDTTFTALLDGLGIHAGTVRHIPAPELARLVGGMLRVATQGTMTALRSRSMAKRETRIAMTLIEERDNNPLKFFPDVDMALTQMLGARGAGYLAPEDALQEAFRDIQAHELAVVAGMRAALEHAMSRIDPVTIDRSLEAAKGLDALLGNRRARLWQRFVDTWEHVARDAGDDFQRTFGEPFSRAYQAQLDALTRTTPSE